MKEPGIQALVPLSVFLFTALGILISPTDISSGRSEHARNAHVLEPHADEGMVSVHQLDDPLAAAMKECEEHESEPLTEPQEETKLGALLAKPLRAVKEKRESALEGEDARTWKVRVIAVPVQSGHSSEDTEKRIRTRYAVASALRTENFLPVDRDHLRWFGFRFGAEREFEGLVVVEVYSHAGPRVGAQAPTNSTASPS